MKIISAHGIRLFLFFFILIQTAEAGSQLSPPRLSANDEARLLSRIDVNKIKISPVELEGWPTQTDPHRIHFLDFFKSVKNPDKPEVIKIKLYGYSGKKHLYTRIIRTSDALSGYGFLDMTGQEIDNALKKGAVMLKIYPGIRNDLFGDVFTTKGIEKSISGVQSRVITDRETQALLENLSKKGTIKIKRGMLEIKSINVFNGAGTIFKIEFWDGQDRLLDTRTARYDQGRVFFTGSEIKSAAQKGTLRLRIYPGMFAVVPWYWEMFNEDDYYEFTPEISPDLIPALSPEKEAGSWGKIETENASIIYVNHHRYGNISEISIPHHLKGENGLLIKGYNSRENLVYTDIVGFNEDGPIVFSLSPEVTTPALFRKDSWITIELTPGMSVFEVNRMLLGVEDIFAFLLKPEDAANYNLFSKKSFFLRIYINGDGKIEKVEPTTSVIKK